MAEAEESCHNHGVIPPRTRLALGLALLFTPLGGGCSTQDGSGAPETAAKGDDGDGAAQDAASKGTPGATAPTGDVDESSEAPPATPSSQDAEKTAVPDDAPSCGGFAGLRCPDGLTCIDDPRDDCDPKRGGADCMGVCVANCEDQARSYKSRDPEMCARMRFACGEGESYFGDACGCGCLSAAG